ncbi:hypothetical protein HPB47_013176, partial [Ixodes persulcatus]
GLRKSQAGFLKKTKKKGPHKTIGAIDGYHVKILRPTGFFGSAHDARILKESPIFKNAESKCT